MPFSIPTLKEVRYMFSVDGTTITVSRGDTGAVKINASAIRRDNSDNYIFGERDRAVFTIKSNNGTLVRERSYQMRNNQFTVVFYNQDTESFEQGSYQWDVRYVINPYYDEEMPNESSWTDYDNLDFPVDQGTRCKHEGTYYTATQEIEVSETWNPDHWECADYRIPVDGDQVITPTLPLSISLLNVVGTI